MATAEFSKFAGILSAALLQHHLSGFEIAQLEFQLRFLLGNITINKPSGGDRIPAELLKILKDDAVKVLRLIY